MIIIEIFLILVWIVVTAAVLLGGLYLSARFAQDADVNDLPLLKALGGTLIRGFATLALTAVVVGLPLTLLGFK